MSDLIYIPTRTIQFCTNTFEDVKVVLKYENDVMIEVIEVEQAGYTVQIPIYYSDGTYLAKVCGSRLFTTEAGKKAGVSLRHPDGMTVCEMGGKPIVELHRTEAAALKTNAELYAPDGSFLKSWDSSLTGTILRQNAEPWFLKGSGGGAIIMSGSEIVCRGTAIHLSPTQSLYMHNSIIKGAEIGIHISSTVQQLTGQ